MNLSTSLRDDEPRSFHFNKIYVVETLLAPDTLTGKNLFKDLLKPSTYRHPWLGASYHHITNKKQFFELLAQIKRDTLAGNVHPLIHIEGHGSPRGLDVGRGADKTNIKWEDMAPELRKINVASKNNLLLVAASCYGVNIHKSIQITERAPYFASIAPAEEVSQGEVEEKFNTFYDRIINTKDFDQAILELRGASDGGKARFTYIQSEVAFGVVRERMSNKLRDSPDLLRNLLGTQRVTEMEQRHGLTYDEIIERAKDVFDNRGVVLEKWFENFMMRDLGTDDETPSK